MIEFAASNWGGLVSTIGLAVSVVGLVWAIVVARGARSASRAAEQASQETSAHIARHLKAINLERAIALIQRLKLLHRNERWEAALEQYQTLRMMLAEIAARLTEAEAETRRALIVSIRTIRTIENEVESQPNLGLGPEDKIRLQQRLNRIQSRLESLASARDFGDSQRGPT